MEDILLVHRKSSKSFALALSHVALWKTCLRQILICAETDFPLIEDSLESGDQVLRGEKALSLLLEILCGLHSPVVGETEVFGQFRNFIDTRKQLEDPLFGGHQKWLNFIISEVKKTRAEHLIGMGSQSYGSLVRRYTKNQDAVTLCGSGQLAQEILPWIAHKEHLQLVCRDPSKLVEFANKYSNLSLATYKEAYVHGEALVIAAPISDARILELVSRQDTRPHSVCDLRGEENSLASLLQKNYPHVRYLSLQQFFSEIEETKKETRTRVDDIKTLLLDKAQSFIQRSELRPLGWDDLWS